MADSSDPHQRIRGAGDAIAKITDSLGIRKCGGCQKRQNFLNSVLPAPDFGVHSENFKKALQKIKELGFSIPKDLT